jgi:hypothetical protein
MYIINSLILHINSLILHIKLRYLEILAPAIELMLNKIMMESKRSIMGTLYDFLNKLCLSLLILTAEVQAQDMEARAYSNAPIGTNFLGGGYSYSSGGISIDPTAPVSNIDAKINGYSAAYVRFFDLGGRIANFGLAAPYYDADISGDVGEERKKINRTGIGDMRFRLATNLIGGPALTPQEFALRTPGTTLGISATIVAPTGEYNSEHLINIGTNRWSFKPEIGITQPIGNWFIEGSGGVWFFTDNNNFFGGQERSQDPIESFQLHSGYNFSPGLWLAGDATYWTGGETTLGGQKKNDLQSSSRYGVTLSVPLSKSFSAKLSWSTGYTTRLGQDFDTVLAVVQYRWIDG